MTRIGLKHLAGFWTATALFVQIFVLPGVVISQEEVASALRRYKDQEVSTGYYEQTEMMPRNLRPRIEVPEIRKGVLPYSPTAAQIRIRTRMTDSHLGIKFYKVLTCEYCHTAETKDFHTVRANLTCRQCHGGEPISGILNFYSPLNPIRRYAYVCAKCHEGASESFATYVVHEPPPGSRAARIEFPTLYYTFWFMMILLVGTLAFFIPHSFLVGVRELIMKIRKTDKKDADDIH